MQISVIVPLHNEGPWMEALFRRFLQDASQLIPKTVFEVLLVENGSRDDTYAKALELQSRIPGLFRVFDLPQPSYGQALKVGISNAAGSHISILECDCLDVSFLGKSIERFRAGERFVLASKRHPASHDRRPYKRRLMTYVFNRLLVYSTGYDGSDTRGPKSLETQLARRLDQLSQTSGEAFQTELVLLAWKLGITISEVPIDLAEVRTSPVSSLSRIPKTLALLRELKKSSSRSFPDAAG